ncbi:unnamed protein product, partial [marine sediment metagenome]
ATYNYHIIQLQSSSLKNNLKLPYHTLYLSPIEGYNNHTLTYSSTPNKTNEASPYHSPISK